MKITLVGIDLAKRVFQLHGVDAKGKAVLKKSLKRERFAEFIANLPQATLAMEACGSAHYWARRFLEMGHTVKLVTPQRAKQFRNRSSKDDAADAEAICEAARSPNTRFVPVKNSWQQDVLFVHRIRQRKVEARTALLNEVRGFLYECGIIFKQGPKAVKDAMSALIAIGDERVTPHLMEEIPHLLKELRDLEDEIKRLDAKIAASAERNDDCKRLLTIPGVGVLTASAVVATAGSAAEFKNGRHFAAWLGLVPGHTGTGGKVRMLPITKRGDRYLRGLLVHGARAVIAVSARKPERKDRWLSRMSEEKHTNKVAVALANRNARTIWALLSKKEDYSRQIRLTKAA